ncbi:MAG: hypothetical protein HY824_02810 [Acidobacteria bacterium]|nr:hypothetical protein [Acidobacteriota bacterium]
MGCRLFALLLLFAVPAAAQQSVAVQFNGGRVTLRAQNATIRGILAEWARLGGATIVNADRVAGPPVTLELTDVPERQALDIILRNVAGYMLAPRRAGAAGASAFDRILILPTSVAPRNPPPAASASSGPRPALPRPAPVLRPPAAAVDTPADAAQPDEVEAEADPQASPPTPRVIPRPLPGMPPGAGRPVPPGIAPLQDNDDQDDQATPAAQTGTAPTPANPFGVPFGSSATPGVIAPVPRTQPQQQQQQPGQPNRVP